MRGFNKVVFIVSLAIFGAACEPNAEQPDKPNVLVIIADDMGWGDIGYNNPTHVYTPNLDKLSSGAVKFAQHYVMPQCTPTRVSVFTGRYPGRFPYYGKVATNQKCFDAGTPTLATMLKEEGYRTHIAGKWHMGSDTINGPNKHGFDESYGSLAGASGMYDHRYRTGPYEQCWHRNMKPIEGNEDGVHVTELMTQETQRVIREKSDQPFFMFLTFHTPHTPLDERGEFIDRPTQLDPNDTTRWLDEDKIKWFNDPEGKIQSDPDPEKRLLLAAINHLDDGVGRIIKILEEEGKLENTIILFSSDNGPQVFWPGNAYPDDLRLTDFNQSIPMRGKKLDVYEGGIHVPGFIYWKGHIAPKTFTSPVHIVDWFPTLASITGHESNTYQLDGEDLSPVLFGDGQLPDRDLYWIWSNEIDRWALRYKDWKIVKYGEGQPTKPEDWQLFDLSKDPKEGNDLSSEFPEILADLHQRFLVQRARDI